MRTLAVVAAVMLVPFLAPQPAHAQGCCGESVGYRAYCGEGCGLVYIYSCDEGGGNSWMAPAQFQCGSGGSCPLIGTYIPSGYCYDGAVDVPSGHPRVTAETIENTIYVNAYVKTCGGKYVAVLMAVARQAG